MSSSHVCYVGCANVVGFEGREPTPTEIPTISVLGLPQFTSKTADSLLVSTHYDVYFGDEENGHMFVHCGEVEGIKLQEVTLEAFQAARTDIRKFSERDPQLSVAMLEEWLVLFRIANPRHNMLTFLYQKKCANAFVMLYYGVDSIDPPHPYAMWLEPSVQVAACAVLIGALVLARKFCK